MPLAAAWLLAAAVAEVPDATSERVIDERELVEDDDQVRLSLPTEEDHKAWALPGFRVQLGYAFGRVRGARPSFPFTTNGATLRPSVRIDPRWSLAASFTYAVATGKVEGLRFGAALEPTFHPLPALGLSLGVGYGGIVGNILLTQEEAERASRLFGPSAEVAGRALGPDEVLSSCEGAGLYALARAEYLFVVGPLFSTGPFLVADVARVRCEQFGPDDPETGQRVTLWQWWQQWSWSLGWWFAWR